MSLRTDTVDGNALSNPFVDQTNHPLCLSVVCDVEAVLYEHARADVGTNHLLVIVDVELGVWVSGPCSAECDSYEVLAAFCG
jgi:hypothetical protein